MRKFTFLLSALVASLTISAEVITLDLSKPTNPESFAFDANGMWTETFNETEYPYIESQVFGFSHLPSANSYSGTSWEGFTVSKATKDGEGYGYYSNMAKGGINGEGTPYIFAYYSEFWLMNEDNEDMMSSNHIIFNNGQEYYPCYVYLNNSVIGHHDVVEGSAYGRKFAKGDRFEVWIQGLDADYEATEEKVIYRLADYTSENEADWFVNTEWAKVDLSPLGKVAGLTFTVVSTDQGAYGTNTATYFALDGLTVSTTAPKKVATFENEVGGINVAKADTCWQGADVPVAGWNDWKSGDYAFQTYSDGSGYYYSAFTVTNETANTSTGYLEPYRNAKGGAYEGENFVVWNMNYYSGDTVSFDAQVVPGFFVNNTAYAVTSMLNGDAFAKRFEQEDWFKLTITGLKDKAAGKSVDFYLAKDGKYVADWTYVDLSELGEIDGVVFSMSSSDSGEWGMNTPAYFAMDNFGATMPEGYIEPARAEFPVVVDINITSGAVLTNAIAEEGWWQIVAPNEEYIVYICTADGSSTQVAGTYTVADLDADYSGIEFIDTEESISFTEGSITVSVDAESGDITVAGKLTGEDGVIYNIYIVYSEPKPETVVDVKIDNAELDGEFTDWGLYIVAGQDTNGVTVQLGIWLDNDRTFEGDFTEEDLDTYMAGSFVAVGEEEYTIYTAAINVVPGNLEGEYKITADLLCYNNTLYKVEMLIPAKESGLSDINAAVKAQKLIRDGQVLILRNGKTINMHGVEVK